MHQELRTLSDFCWQRLWSRLDGLTDEEYFWEPVPGCWNVRQGTDDIWAADWERPAPEPAPFTTIATRLWHLIDMYGEDRAPTWLDLAPQGAAVGPDGPHPHPPGTASEALTLLSQAHDRWDAHLRLATDETLGRPLGEIAGPWAEATRAAYVLHMLDEFIHHGAEVGVLRDLWRAQVAAP